jgi:hypothetical protein
MEGSIPFTRSSLMRTPALAPGFLFPLQAERFPSFRIDIAPQ